ncbi:MAG: zinc ribbon domain-containing protein [Thermoplasmata archaeon]
MIIVSIVPILHCDHCGLKIDRDLNAAINI